MSRWLFVDVAAYEAPFVGRDGSADEGERLGEVLLPVAPDDLNASATVDVGTSARPAVVGFEPRGNVGEYTQPRAPSGRLDAGMEFAADGLRKTAGQLGRGGRPEDWSQS